MAGFDSRPKGAANSFRMTCSWPYVSSTFVVSRHAVRVSRCNSTNKCRPCSPGSVARLCRAVSVDGASKQQAMTRGLWHGVPTRSENRRPEDEATAIPWNALVQQTNKEETPMDVSISHQARGF
jgi:hypothetical protein